MLYYGLNLFAQHFQIHFVPQTSAEGYKGLFGIVLAAEEAPVDDVLDAPPKRVEQRRDQQGGDDDRQG